MFELDPKVQLILSVAVLAAVLIAMWATASDDPPPLPAPVSAPP